jgi:hypothetical protein
MDTDETQIQNGSFYLRLRCASARQGSEEGKVFYANFTNYHEFYRWNGENRNPQIFAELVLICVHLRNLRISADSSSGRLRENQPLRQNEICAANTADFCLQGEKNFVGSFSYVSEVLTSFVNCASTAYGCSGKIRYEKYETD